MNQFVVLFEENKFEVKKKGNSIYLELGNNVIFVLNLQKSQWSDCYYINLGFYLSDNDLSEKYPKAHLCQVQKRLVPDAESDKCYEIGNHEVQDEIIALFRNTMIDRIKMIEDFSSLVERMEGTGFYLDADAQRLLGIARHKL